MDIIQGTLQRYILVTFFLLITIGMIIFATAGPYRQSRDTVPSVQLTRFSVLNASCGVTSSAEATITTTETTNGKQVTVTGIAELPNPCHTIKPQFTQLENGTYILRLDSISLNKTCTTCVGNRYYEAEIAVRDDASIVVVHDNTRMAQETVDVHQLW